MKIIFATITFIILVSPHSFAFFDDLKEVVEQGTLKMAEKGNGIFDSVFQCPPFTTEPEAEQTWKKQVADFCKGEFKVIEKRYEKNDINADTIYATIECKALAGIEQVPPETEKTETTKEPSPVVALKPEKTKKVLKEETTADTPALELDPVLKKYIAKLDSYDAEIFRNNAKEIYYKNLTNPVLLDAIEKVLLSTYRLDQGNIRTDGLGWLCKVLGGSGQGKYIETLDKIATSGATFKLRWHAALQRDKIVKRGATPPQTDEQKKIDIEKKLVELKELFDQGLITKSEYSEKKAELLEKM